jgi:hypothetical protein
MALSFLQNLWALALEDRMDFSYIQRKYALYAITPEYIPSNTADNNNDYTFQTKIVSFTPDILNKLLLHFPPVYFQYHMSMRVSLTKSNPNQNKLQAFPHSIDSTVIDKDRYLCVICILFCWFMAVWSLCRKRVTRLG